MSATETKQKILQTSLALFNRRGFVNVTLRDIASRAGISTGNLAYHYRNKDVIIEQLYEQMERELARMWSRVQLLPTFDNIDRYIRLFYQFQETYRFFSLDMLEIGRAYPAIAAANRRQIDTQIRNIRAMIDYSVGVGNMQPEVSPGMYDQLAHTVWMLQTFWLTQRNIRQDAGTTSAARSIWALVIPHLTPKGEQIFQNIFAESYGFSLQQRNP